MVKQSFSRTHPPQADERVGEFLARRPGAVAVFIARGMACPGCAMVDLMSLREAAEAYRLDLQDLLDDLTAA